MHLLLAAQVGYKPKKKGNFSADVNDLVEIFGGRSGKKLAGKGPG